MANSLKLPIQYRKLQLSDNGVDVEKRTAKFSISSENPVERGYGKEILSHKSDAIVTKRLDAKAVPFLDSHDWSKQIGTVTDYIADDRNVNVSVKFSRKADANDALADMHDGVRTGISVGYIIHEMSRTNDPKDKNPEYTVTKWEPIEVSLVSVPADYTIGVGRDSTELYEVRVLGDTETEVAIEDIKVEEQSIQQQPPEVEQEAVVRAPVIINNEILDKHMEEQVTRESNVQLIQQEVDKATNAELSRIREITALGLKFNLSKEAEEYVNNKKSVADFTRWALDNCFEKLKPNLRQSVDPTDSLPIQQKKRYSIGKAILQASGFNENGTPGGKLDGFEAECSQEIARSVQRQPGGFFCPEFVFDSRYNQRADLAALTANIGGDLIQTTVEPSLIPLLRNKMVVGRAGCTMMGGLVGNMALPRQITAATATWNTENYDPTRTNQTFDQVLLNPQRLSAVTAFSKQLLLQTNIDVQTVVRDDLLKIVAIAQDLAALAGPVGTGNVTTLEAAGDSPIGILGMTADTSYPSAYSKTSPAVTFGSGYPTWADCVQFEGNVEANNIDLDDTSCAYVTSPAVKTLWKTLAKVDARATNQFYPEFLWEELKISPDGSSGRVNGYKAFATNQLSSSNKVIFGKFSDLVIGTWGGLDLITDPYTLASAFQIRVIVNLLCTIAFRYGPAFCYSTDSGLVH